MSVVTVNDDHTARLRATNFTPYGFAAGVPASGIANGLRVKPC